MICQVCEEDLSLCPCLDGPQEFIDECNAERWSDRQTVEELTRNEQRATARAINRGEV